MTYLLETSVLWEERRPSWVTRSAQAIAAPMGQCGLFLGRTGFSDSPVVMKGLPSECMYVSQIQKAALHGGNSY